MQRPDEKKRKLIAETAARLFATRPFHKVKLDDVAAAVRAVARGRIRRRRGMGLLSGLEDRTFNIRHSTSNKDRAFNVHRPTFNSERDGTSNVQHRTSDFELPSP